MKKKSKSPFQEIGSAMFHEAMYQTVKRVYREPKLKRSDPYAMKLIAEYLFQWSMETYRAPFPPSNA
jgi:hypothetical protein